MSKRAYLVYSLQSKDRLYNLECRCKCLYDYELHIQHLQHSHKDQHIFHFDKQEWLDILDLSSTHRACILHRDYPYVLEDIDI